MSDLLHRPAIGASGVALTLLPEAGVFELLGRAGAPAPGLEGLRATGPGRWYYVGDLAAEALAARLPDVAVVDQSHGRVRIGVAGPAAAAMLAKGTAVDLAAMAVGASAATMVGPIGVHMTRTGPEAFELMVLRGFAESLWHDLRSMAGEYG